MLNAHVFCSIERKRTFMLFCLFILGNIQTPTTRIALPLPGLVLFILLKRGLVLTHIDIFKSANWFCTLLPSKNRENFETGPKENGHHYAFSTPKNQ